MKFRTFLHAWSFAVANTVPPPSARPNNFNHSVAVSMQTGGAPRRSTTRGPAESKLVASIMSIRRTACPLTDRGNRRKQPSICAKQHALAHKELLRTTLTKASAMRQWMTIVFCLAPDILAAWPHVAPAVFSHEQFKHCDLPSVLLLPRRVGFRVRALASGSD